VTRKRGATGCPEKARVVLRVKEGRLADDDVVKRVDAALCRHLSLTRSSDVAWNLSRQYFNVGEGKVRAALARAREAADALAKALVELSPVFARGALDPSTIAGLPSRLGQLSRDLASAEVPQETKPRAAWVADRAAELWTQRWGHRPTVSVRQASVNRFVMGHTTGGAFVDFVAALYDALGIKASAKSQADRAVRRLR
jgi:hypothetical protein